MTFGGLLGGAGGSVEACRTMQILQSMARMSTHARLPLRGCGEYILRATPSAAGPHSREGGCVVVALLC